MNDPRDETTPPVGHGFAFSEPFPLDDSDRIEALQRQNDELAAVILSQRAMLTEARQFWVADGTELAKRIDASIGTKPRGVAAMQYGGG